MSKAKAESKRDPKLLPPRPPQDLAEAVLFGAASEINEKVEADYIAAIYKIGRKGGKKAKEDQMRAILLMATVGFSFINWQKKRTLV